MLKIFGNGTDTVAWVPEPTTRGTFTILSSCLTTILLCVWTAVHLNVPEPRDEKRPWFAKRQLWRRLAWFVMTLLAPELVAYAAFCQYSTAKLLRKEISRSEGPNFEISLREAFYAIMGGYVLHAYKSDGSSLFSDQRTHFLLDESAIFDMVYSYPDLLEKFIPEKEISDKSKASGVAKAVVCVQAGWFTLQCLTRIALSHPITLLELNTFGHSVCVLLVYIFWWHKPMDVEQPTSIAGSQADEFAAFLWLISMDFNPETIISPQNEELVSIQVKSMENPSLPKATGEVNSDTRHRIELEIPRKYGYPQDISTDIVQLAEGPLTRCYEHFREIQITRLPIPDRVANWPVQGSVFWTRGSTIKRPLPLKRDATHMKNLGNFLHLCFYISGFIYGGLHALAWNANFRSPLEKSMWQISSVAIMASTLVMDCGLLLLRGLLFGPNDKWESMCSLKLSYPAVFFALVYTVLAAYLLARLYLIIECFVSLPNSSSGVYETLLWSNYVPHIV